MAKRSISVCVVVAFIVTSVLLVPTLLQSTADAKTRNKTPAKYDLRSKGLVTPVKKQDPFSSCWAFGGIAAAESSLLKAEGTTYKKSHIDLSEKHVVWFALHPISKKEDKRQAGEGLYAFEKGKNAVYDTGGFGMFVTSLFSSGSGPMPESYFPYCGKNGLTEYDVLEKSREKEIEKYTDILKTVWGYEQKEKKFKTAEEFLADYAKNQGYESTGTFEGDAVLMFQKDLDTMASPYENGYSEKDDWSIPVVNKDGDRNRMLYWKWTLKDGNLLPEFAKRNKKEKWKGISKAGTRAVKSELMKGHAVNMCICADESAPGESKAHYMNNKTWAHYTYDNKETNHAVCIVGWDDKYSRKNFNKGHRPEKNGAWLVKNSWGSESPDSIVETKTGHKIGMQKWGVKDKKGRHTGYFYVSYYDKSISTPETMTFSKDFAKDKGFYCTQYDYMPAVVYLKFGSSKKVRAANMFRGEGKSKLKSVSTATAVSGTKVKFDVYKLKKNAKKPDDGRKVRSFTKQFAYAGFHRANLKKVLKIKKGEKYSVVTTQYYRNSKKKKVYYYCAAAMLGKKLSKKAGAPAYGRAVVNKGESYVFTGGKWKDWKSFRNSKTMKKTIKARDLAGILMDNFAIKSYLVR